MPTSPHHGGESPTPLTQSLSAGEPTVTRHGSRGGGLAVLGRDWRVVFAYPPAPARKASGWRTRARPHRQLLRDAATRPPSGASWHSRLSGGRQLKQVIAGADPTATPSSPLLYSRGDDSTRPMNLIPTCLTLAFDSAPSPLPAHLTPPHGRLSRRALACPVRCPVCRRTSGCTVKSATLWSVRRPTCTPAPNRSPHNL